MRFIVLGILSCAVACRAPKQGHIAEDVGSQPDAGPVVAADPAPDAGAVATTDPGPDAGPPPAPEPDAGPAPIVPANEWRWENPTPTGVALRGAWAASSADVWAVGNSGALLHYDGKSWSRAPSPTAVSLGAVWGTGSANAWAAGDQGTLLHYDGAAWRPVASGTSAPLGALSGTAADDLWASSAPLPVAPNVNKGGPAPGAALLHFDGRAWKQVAFDAPTAVAALARNDVWAGSCGAVRHFDGAKWTSFSAPAGCIRNLAGVPGGPVFAVNLGTTPCNIHNDSILCPAPSLLRFDGAAWVASDGPADALGTFGGLVWGFRQFGGETLSRFDAGVWKPIAFPGPGVPDSLGDWVHALAPVSEREAWIVGEDGRLMHYDGETLTDPRAYETINNIWAMAGSSDCDVWAVGNDGLVLHRGCDGAWARIDLTALGVMRNDQYAFEPRQLLGVTAPAPDDVWIVAMSGDVYHFDGARWSNETTPAHGLATSLPSQMYAPARGDVYVASALGLFHRDAGGWHQVLGNLGDGMSAVWGSAPDDVWAASSDGAISHFDGKTWSLSFTHPWSDGGFTVTLTGTRRGEVWFAASDAILHFDGAAWKAVPVPSGISGLAALGGGELWAAGIDPAHPSLYSFDGRSWTEHAAEVAPGFVFATATTVFAYGLNSSYVHGGDILSRPR